jgi:murein DD-endopeptidase MepM/ murein hydrolase activator NlpD
MGCDGAPRTSRAAEPCQTWGVMARRHWTLVVVPGEEGTVRQFRLREELVRVSVAVALIVFALLAILSAGFFVKESHRLRAQQLEQEKTLLTRELSDLRENIDSLRSTLEDLSVRDEHYRLLAGLDPIHEEVRLAGIGGPGTETLQSNQLWNLDPDLGSATFAAAYDLNGMLRRARLLEASWEEATTRLEREHERLQARPSIWPTRGHLSSPFTNRRRHPLLHRVRPHEGMDVAAPRGTPIVATARGRVTFVGRRGNYGLMVELDHGHGIVTRYAHASQVLVRQGQMVQRGEKIAEVGATGLALGTHVHYEVRVDGRPVDPMLFILDREVAP